MLHFFHLCYASVKKLLFIFLSLLLLGAFAPSQSYACGAGCKKESTPAACETEKKNPAVQKPIKHRIVVKKISMVGLPATMIAAASVEESAVPIVAALPYILPQSLQKL